MAERSLRQLWSRDATAFGFMCAIPSAFSAELIADAGFDFLIIDQQHGLIGYDSMVSMLQAADRLGVSSLVRVASHAPHLISAALDAGAAGVVVPVVESATEAAAVVAACRYPPTGRRSFGPSRSTIVHPGSPSQTNDNIVCVVMIETVAGLEAVDDITGCPGVDAVIPGWADLALSLGIAPDRHDPLVEAALTRIRRSSLEHGVVAAIGGSADEARSFVEQGYRMISIGSDLETLRTGAAGALARVRDTSN